MLGYGAYPNLSLNDTTIRRKGTYRFYKRPTVLSHDNDIPDIPYPFSRILVFDALLELYTYNDANPPAYWITQSKKYGSSTRQALLKVKLKGLSRDKSMKLTNMKVK